jgi:hypothetical protein
MEHMYLGRDRRVYHPTLLADYNYVYSKLTEHHLL